MIMIIGGSFQGKEAFANQLFPTKITFADGNTCAYEDIYSCDGIRDFHMFVKRFLDSEDLDSLAHHLSAKNPDIIIVSDEIGYGIVPIDKTERLWREKTGRLCCQLMQYSTSCYRVVAGIGTKIKG